MCLCMPKRVTAKGKVSRVVLGPSANSVFRALAGTGRDGGATTNVSDSQKCSLWVYPSFLFLMVRGSLDTSLDTPCVDCSRTDSSCRRIFFIAVPHFMATDTP